MHHHDKELTLNQTPEEKPGNRVPFLTVFTPTYNRAYILPELYATLLIQSCGEFVWMIIDDGSDDGTESLVQKWVDEKKLEIIYRKQENGGKQRAHNTAVSFCATDCFLCVDSDDYLTGNAVELLKARWEKVRSNVKISGIVALKGYDEKTPMGSPLPKGIEYSSLTGLYQKHGFSGETALLFRTAYIRPYPYPVAEGEKFITESYLYLQLDQHYTMSILDEIINICGYQDDGYTKNIHKVFVRNPISYMRLKKLSMDLASSPKYRMLNAVNLLSAYFILRRKHRNFSWNALTLSAFIPGYLLFLLRFRKHLQNV